MKRIRSRRTAGLAAAGLFAVAIALLAFALSRDASPDERASKAPCEYPGTSDFRKNQQVRVFKSNVEIVDPALTDGDDIAEGDYAACDLESGKTRFVFVDEWDSYPPLWMSLRGHFVAGEYDWSCGACGSPPITFELLDVRSGRAKILEEVIDDDSDHDFKRHSAVLTEAGTIVYVVTRRSGNVEKTEVVRYDASTGRRKVLDSGSTIKTKSLKLDGTTVSWTNAGSKKTVTVG